MQTSHEIVNVVEHEQKTESRYKARPVVALSWYSKADISKWVQLRDMYHILSIQAPLNLKKTIKKSYPSLYYFNPYF